MRYTVSHTYQHGINVVSEIMVYIVVGFMEGHSTWKRRYVLFYFSEIV
jgi:hypothetical protein